MREVDRISNEGLYVEMRDIIQIGNKAIKQAKEDNKRYGIPEVFFKNGKLYYELLDGVITTDRPTILGQKE